MNGDPWGSIAISDWYRQSNQRDQQMYKALWLRDKAPLLYQDMQTNPMARMSVMQSVMNTPVIPILPDESLIVTPQTLHIEGIKRVEGNTTFTKKTYAEQQALKQLWYMKMAAADPEFQAIDFEGQREYYRKLMLRAPSMGSAMSGLLSVYDTEDERTQALRWNTAQQSTRAIVRNFAGSALTSFGALFLGPLRALSGPDSELTKMLVDVEKDREWINHVTSELSPFLTKMLPSFTGYMAGLIVSPFMGLEKVLAGGTIYKAGKGLIKTAGALERGGKALGITGVPSLVYQTTGGGLAGVIQGIGEGLAEGKDWKTYIPRDATMGVVMEFASRYVGMMRAISKAARAAGEPVENLIRAPFDVGTAGPLRPELKGIFEAHPDAYQFCHHIRAVDKDGLILSHLDTPEGFKMKAEAMRVGFRVDINPDDISVYRYGKLRKKFEGGEATRVVSANGWLDYNDDAWRQWDKTRAGKAVMEAIETAPQAELRVGSYVPAEGRRTISRFLDRHRIDLAIEPDLDIGDARATLDRIYGILQKQSPRKASETFSQLKIQFSDDIIEHRAAVKDLKGELDKLNPKAAYLIQNVQTHGVLTQEEIPLELLDSDFLKQPGMYSNVYMGNANSIRQTVNSLKKSYSLGEAAKTKVAKTNNASIERFVDTQIIELRVHLPEGKDAIIHFKSLKEAQQALVTGKVGKAKEFNNMLDNIFDQDAPVAQSYRDYVKARMKYGREAASKDFLPYSYLAKQADQQGYYLGTLRGQYIIQDVLDDTGKTVKYHTCKTLSEVATFLENNDGRHLQPDLLSGLKQEAIEEIYPRGIDDLMKDLTPVEIVRNRKYDVRMWANAMLSPPQYTMQQFEKLSVVGKLAEKYNFSPMRFHDTMQNMTRGFRQYTAPRSKYIKGLGRGVKKSEVPYLFRWAESLDDVAEVSASPIRLRDYELKSDVVDEMVGKFGRERTDVLLEKTARLHQYLDKLFSESGMNWGMYRRHYIPHLAEEVRKVGTTTRIDPKKFIQIPETDREAFFEMLREVDPKDFAWEQDIFRLADIYTHLLGRKQFTRKAMKDMAGLLRHMTAEMTKANATPGDYSAVVNYISEVFSTIEGIQAPPDRLFEYATDQTLEIMADAVNAKFGTHFKMKGKTSMWGKLMTLTTGAHLAGRPYPIARNLTQSAVTGGTTIGTRWWMEGVDRSLKPGAIKRLQDLGVIAERMIPTAAGSEIMSEGAVGWAVHTGMRGYKWADFVNRAIVYNGMEARIESALSLYRKGKIRTGDKFARKAGANLFGKEHYNEAIRILNFKGGEPGFKAFKDYLANIAVQRTQYLYNSFDQPQIFRRGLGRFAGQYTSWPINYFNLVKERLSRHSGLSTGQKIGFLARTGAVTGAIATGLHSFGIDPSSYAPWNMVMFQGGPYYQMLNDFMLAINGDRGAYRGLVKTLTSLVPFSYEGEGVMRAVEALKDGELHEAFLWLASAPVRTDVYPRRETLVDTIENALIKGGDIYYNNRRTDLVQEGKNLLGVDFGL